MAKRATTEHCYEVFDKGFPVAGCAIAWALQVVGLDGHPERGYVREVDGSGCLGMVERLPNRVAQFTPRERMVA